MGVSMGIQEFNGTSSLCLEELPNDDIRIFMIAASSPYLDIRMMTNYGAAIHLAVIIRIVRLETQRHALLPLYPRTPELMQCRVS